MVNSVHCYPAIFVNSNLAFTSAHDKHKSHYKSEKANVSNVLVLGRSFLLLP